MLRRPVEPAVDQRHSHFDPKRSWECENTAIRSREYCAIPSDTSARCLHAGRERLGDKVAERVRELDHYYRASGLPFERQPWLASAWRRG